MSRRLALVLAPLLLGMAGPWVQAQTAVTRNQVPSRTSLARVGLERNWMIVVPLSGSEQVLRISRSTDLFFVQTNQAMLHVYDVETGRHRWSTQLGEQASYARPVSSNSFGVFASCANILLALDRETGRPIWRTNLETMPTSGTACDEHNLIVGMDTGMLKCFRLRENKENAPQKVLAKPELAWNLKTNGRIDTLPLMAENVSFLGSDDGRVFATMTREPTPLYRVKTGGAIGEGLGTYGTRTLLIPSADYNLYAVDVLTTKMLWVFPSGASITQAPMIVGEDVFAINTAGDLSVLDPTTGSPRWTLPTHSARLMAASGSKIYLRTIDNDLLVVDRKGGVVIADSAATFERAGLDLRDYDHGFPNRFDDRMYLGSSSGLIVSLREMGQVVPVPLRKPEAEPFAHVPPEGVKEKPAPAPEPVEAPADAEPGAEPTAPDAPSEFK